MITCKGGKLETKIFIFRHSNFYDVENKIYIAQNQKFKHYFHY